MATDDSPFPDLTVSRDYRESCSFWSSPLRRSGRGPALPLLAPTGTQSPVESLVPIPGGSSGGAAPRRAAPAAAVWALSPGQTRRRRVAGGQSALQSQNAEIHFVVRALTRPTGAPALRQLYGRRLEAGRRDAAVRRAHRRAAPTAVKSPTRWNSTDRPVVPDRLAPGDGLAREPAGHRRARVQAEAALGPGQPTGRERPPTVGREPAPDRGDRLPHRDRGPVYPVARDHRGTPGRRRLR